MLAEDDPVKMQMDIIDEQVDTIGRAFMGLTLGCARCHDHKFDPIPASDYYALAGVLKSTKTMDHFNVVAKWQERELSTAKFKRDSAQFEKDLADKQDEIKRLECIREKLGKEVESLGTVRKEIQGATLKLEDVTQRRTTSTNFQHRKAGKGLGLYLSKAMNLIKFYVLGTFFFNFIHQAL